MANLKFKRSSLHEAGSCNFCTGEMPAGGTVLTYPYSELTEIGSRTRPLVINICDGCLDEIVAFKNIETAGE